MLLEWKMFLSTYTKLGASGLTLVAQVLKAYSHQKLSFRLHFFSKVEF